ncbi:MAG: N-acetylmuramate alpha-1-phosphate uridylyltransferase MurU [Dokdonella sp.]
MKRAMIFAAGRGERMRPLTDSTPKPLLEVGGKRLIEWHLEKLAAAGFSRVVINTSWLADQFPEALGDGSRWNLGIDYINEGPVPLETGGGMLNALDLLGDESFLLINGDVWTDMDFATLSQPVDSEAHLLMVANPAHVARGDFALEANGYLVDSGPARLTYSGIGLYRASLFADWQSAFATHADAYETPPRFPLAPLLRDAMHRQKISGEFSSAEWFDIGTPQRLAALDGLLHKR